MIKRESLPFEWFALKSDFLFYARGRIHKSVDTGVSFYDIW
jgi:hypothetical protein